DLLKEVGALHFLNSRGPRDVVREEVREDGLAQRDGKSAEEEKATRAKEGRNRICQRENTILQKTISDRAGAKEHNSRGEPNLKRVHVEPVHSELEAEQHVIDDADRYRARNTVVREHVCVRALALFEVNTQGKRRDAQAIIAIL
ncbi:hypothetical protein C0991_006923, partial [Blastosporella zonata]